jgi:PAS domain S-box-containing protein
MDPATPRRSEGAALGSPSSSDATLAIVEVIPGAYGPPTETQVNWNAFTSEEGLRELFAQAPVGMAVLQGRELRYTSANLKYRRTIGNRDPVGLRMVELFPELAGSEMEQVIQRVHDTGVPFATTDQLMRFDSRGNGEMDNYYDLLYHPIASAGGSARGVLVVATDVTEHRSRYDREPMLAATREVRAEADEARERAESSTAALIASEARYRALTEAVPVQVWTAVPTGELDFVSEQAVAYFGVPADELLGVGWLTFLHPDDYAQALDRWSLSLESGTPYQSEFRLRHGATGAYRWHLARALAERDASGAVIGWVGSNTDVEDERSARAEAEAANRARGEFLAVMSHELRTPLNAIGGYAELMELGIRGPVTAEQRLDLARIQKSQRHLLGLINGVLNYAKVGAGAVHYMLEEVRLDEVLATCEALIAPQVRNKRLTLSFAGCDPAIAARADREKVQQVVLNLVSNAVKFTDPGGRVTLDCAALDGWVVVRVMDTGRGIAADQLERVFQPFVQVDAKLTRTQEGTGLGLAISRDLARGMGGDLMVTSRRDDGSVFTLTLPIASGADELLASA